jgi:hypothetical protein
MLVLIEFLWFAKKCRTESIEQRPFYEKQSETEPDLSLLLVVPLDQVSSKERLQIIPASMI